MRFGEQDAKGNGVRGGPTVAHDRACKHLGGPEHDERDLAPNGEGREDSRRRRYPIAGAREVSSEESGFAWQRKFGRERIRRTACGEYECKGEKESASHRY